MPNTNNQTIHQFGAAISQMVRQATGRDVVESLDMDWVTVEQTSKYYEKSGDVVRFYTTLNRPMKVVADINLVQDLNGEKAPYPPGGGINQFNPDSVSEYNINGDTRNGHEYTTPGTYAVSSYGSGDSCYIIARIKNSNDTWESIHYVVEGTDITLGAVLTIEEGQALYVYDGTEHTSTISEGLFNSWKVQVALSSTMPASYHPYSNICPIEGWDSVLIEKIAGKNIFNPESESTTWVNSENQIITRNLCKTVIIMVKEGQTFTLSNKNFFAVNNIALIAFCDKNDNVLQRYVTSSTSLKSITQTAPAGTAYMIAGMSTWSNAAEVQLEIGEVASGYTPYVDEKQYDIEFPSEAGIVYDGTLTINEDGSGILVVDKVGVLVNSLTWAYDATYTRFSTSIRGIKRGSIRKIPFITSAFISIDDGRGLADVPNNGIYAAGNSDSVYIKSTDYSDVTSFVNAYGTQQIVYPLNAPVTYTFTAQQILAKSGLNTLWADTGPVSVKYITEEEF